MKKELIFIPNPNKSARARLICFSYAGGSASTFLPWTKELSCDVELAVVQLPGRGIRIFETSYVTMEEIVQDLVIAVQEISDKPYFFLGHSMGARVAYELILALYKANKVMPVHFIASGSIAPNIKRSKEKIYELSDEEFIEKIRNLNGTSTEVLENPEIMQMIMPALRADFKIIENYFNKNADVLPSTVSVFAGDREDIKINHIEPWFELFESNNGIHWIHGDHFYIDKNKKAVLTAVGKIIEKHFNSSLKEY